MNIGINLERLLLEKGFTQAQFAKACKIRELFISRYVNNLEEPSASMLYTMATVLQVSCDEFFKNTEPPKQDQPFHNNYCSNGSMFLTNKRCQKLCDTCTHENCETCFYKDKNEFIIRRN